MATNGEDELADFLKREEAKFSDMGESAPRATPPPDTNGAEQTMSSLPRSSSTEDMHSNLSNLVSYSTPMVSSGPVVHQRRPSVEYVPADDMYSVISQEPADTIFSGEPECIQAWRRDKEEALEQKEAESGEEMRRWREAAQQEMGDWYDHHNSQVETRKQENRAAEQAFIEERDQSVPGTEWEKVANLCDFSAKGPGRNTKDVSRMRSIYLHLKENPPVPKH